MLVGTFEHHESARADLVEESTAALLRTANRVERTLPKGWAVLPASMDAHEIARVVESALDHGSDRLVVMPLQPQFARASTGRLLDLLYRTLADLAPDLHVEVRTSWHDDVEYIAAIADLTRATIERDGIDDDACRVLLLPRPPLGSDQMHFDQCVQTARLVAQRLEWPESRVGVLDASACPAADWRTEPTGAGDADHVIVVPIGLVSRPDDDLCLGESFPQRGIVIHRCDPVEASERLAKVVGMIVRRGRHSVSPDRPARRGAGVPSHDEIVGDLFGVGVSVPGAACSAGDTDCSCSNEDFLAIKRPHLEALTLLRDAQAELHLPECWLFNTCHRFELYGWFPVGADAQARAGLLRSLARIVGRDLASSTRIRQGAEAWRHLVRTAAGLNSGLVGDADVIEQLESGLRAAQYAGTTGSRSQALIDRIIASVRALRADTSWGRYTHKYSEAALLHLPQDVQELFGGARITVMGGSTTAVSLLEVLRGRYAVPPERLTVIYRGNRSGPLMNRFLAAVGEDRLLRVETYHDPRTLHGVAGADVAFLAADHREPVFSGRQIVSARAAASLSQPPLVVVDFNSFGSIRDAALPGLRLFDATTIAGLISGFNDRTRSCPDFPAAIAQAEEWIARHADSQFSRVPGLLAGATA
jgi:glutamyl-tRNA reductase